MTAPITTAVRPELPPLTSRIRALPVDHRGYPVPWFVKWIDGKPEFRVMDEVKLVRAIREKLCWVCGTQLGSYKAFVIGPMCAVNRISAEPPSHRDCAEFSVRACPFLTRPHMVRRKGGIVEEAAPAPGIMLERNPGVALLWVTKSFKPFNAKPRGILFEVGDPVEVACFAQGRAATADEIRESVESGLPILRDIAKQDGNYAVVALERQITAARQLLRIAV